MPPGMQADSFAGKLLGSSLVRRPKMAELQVFAGKPRFGQFIRRDAIVRTIRQVVPPNARTKHKTAIIERPRPPDVAHRPPQSSRPPTQAARARRPAHFQPGQRHVSHRVHRRSQLPHRRPDAATARDRWPITEQLGDECPDLELHIRPPTITTPPAVAQVLTDLGFKVVGFESKHITVDMLETWKDLAKTIDWAPQPGLVEAMRIIKDAGEVGQIREAIAVAERAYAMFRAMIEPDATERDLCDSLEMYVRKAGGTATSFPSIVAAGERSALAHAPPTNRTVRSADWLLVDWGAAGTYYKSDLTRLLITRRSWFRPTKARPNDPKLSKVYAAVLAAQERAIAAIRPGVEAKAVDAAARSALADAGYEKAFTHGLGHGLGLQVHEARPAGEFNGRFSVWHGRDDRAGRVSARLGRRPD